jgi:hypothetical protein
MRRKTPKIAVEFVALRDMMVANVSTLEDITIQPVTWTFISIGDRRWRICDCRWIRADGKGDA